MNRPCPFDGCTRTVLPEMFCCRPHWHALTTAEQLEIKGAYMAWRTGEIAAKELRQRQAGVLQSWRERMVPA